MRPHSEEAVVWMSMGMWITSLLRETERFRGLSDMKNCQDASAQGWGPISGGACCTFRISNRTELLRRKGPRFLVGTPPPPSFKVTFQGTWENGGGCYSNFSSRIEWIPGTEC